MASKEDGEDDILTEAKEAFELCEEREAENREEARDDVRFAQLADQWPEEVRKARKLQGRPCQTTNVLPTYIRQVVNDARQNKPSITVHPASDGADEEVADVYNGLIRNIEVTSDADVAYDTALEHAVDRGFGYFRINSCYSDDDSFQQDLRIDAVPNPFSIWADPHSAGADSSDWNVAFAVETITKKEFERKHKGAKAVDWSADYAGLTSPWLSEDEVMVAEYWKREEVIRRIVALSTGEIVDLDVFEAQLEFFQAQGVGVVGSPRPVRSHKVTQYLMTGAEVLETTPWAGKYIPIIPVYGTTVNLEGKRYLRSLIRDAKEPQQNINFWRTYASEVLMQSPKTPFIGAKGAFATDADKWETANTDPHAYIEYDPVGGAGPPQRQPFVGPPAGALQAVIDASTDLKSVIGLHDASMGAPSNESSGRAILARMREGDVSTFHFIDNLSRSIRHAGRVLIDLIPKVYSTPRIVRTMGMDGTPAQVKINQPFQQPVQGPDGQPVMQPQQGPDGQPMTGPDGQPVLTPQTVEKVFDLTAGKYDLTVEAGPSFTTRREEAANQMILLAQADPAILPLIGDILVKNLDWPEHEEIADRIVQARQNQQQPGGREAAEAQAEAQASLAKIQAEGQAKQQLLAQEGQMRQQQMAQEHALALQQSQQQAELDRQKMLGQLQLQREQNEANIQLKREMAAAELELARWTAQQSIALKGAEQAAHADDTVDLPEDTIGGGIG